MRRYENREQYFLELARTSEDYYLNYISTYRQLNTDTKVLEVGCGEGGNLLPFAERGCKVTGIDLSVNKINNAKEYFSERALEGNFICDDFLNQTSLHECGKFDVILVHDVIEHIEPENKNLFFIRLKQYLSPCGIVFFGFPAWHMPFGGHQQICSSRICSHVPFIHLLPLSIYEKYLHLSGEPQYRIDELLSIRRSKMTVESFEALCNEHGYMTIDRKLWLISPHYKVKFNLKPIRLCRWFTALPYIRNYMSTSCFYILSEQAK